MTVFCNTAILFSSLLTSAQAHCPIRKGLVPIKLMGPLTSQNCPLTSQFSAQYLRDFLTVRIHPASYKFLCMPGSCSDPSVCTQETAAHLKIHRASHLRCAPGYRRNDINCLIIGNTNRPIDFSNTLHSNILSYNMFLYTCSPIFRHKLLKRPAV